MWVRGLKLRPQDRDLPRQRVAPYVGAWIETPAALGGASRRAGVPYSGAAVESEIDGL